MSGKRVAKNTLFQIMKMLITTIVNLYMVRILLQELGVEGYGVFNLIAGVLALMMFLNGAMTTSSQRYLSYYCTKVLSERKRVFSTTKHLHLFVALLIAFVLWIAQDFVFNSLINVPAGLLASSHSLYQVMAIGVFASVLTVPFNAQINAYEDLGVDAFLSVVESVLKLASAFIIGFVDNPLTALGVLFVSVSFLMLLVKALYCTARYRECVLWSSTLDVALLKEMVGFTSWNSFGAVCGVARVQGLAIVLNNFFGVTINAVYAIAMQVNGKLKEFSINIMKAINPKIIKAESNGQRSEMLNLSMQASRFSLLLYSVIALPIYFEAKFILSLWLGEYPQEAVPFVKLFLILSLVNLTTIGLQTAIQAIGDVKAYQSTIGSVLLLTIPFAYVVLTLGYPAYSVIVVSIVMEVVSCLMRFGFLRKKAGLSIKRYVFFVLAKALQVLTPTCLVLFAFTSSYEPSYLRVISSGFISFGMIVGLTYWLVLSTEEKNLIRLKV